MATYNGQQVTVIQKPGRSPYALVRTKTGDILAVLPQDLKGRMTVEE